jgi:hypothetical protein
MALAINAQRQSESRFTYVDAWHSVVAYGSGNTGAISAGEIPSRVTLSMIGLLGADVDLRRGPFG